MTDKQVGSLTATAAAAGAADVIASAQAAAKGARKGKSQPKGKLATGNAAAAKPGKVERYALTQEQADTAAQVGQDFAAAELGADAVLAPLAELLAPLSGKINATAPEQWKHIRAAFVQGYMDGMGCTEESAGRAWTRAIQRINAGLKEENKPELIKPMTAAAKAEADRRAKLKPAKTEPEQEDEQDEHAGAGEDAANAVTMELSPSEAHLIHLVRKGKIVQAAEYLAHLKEAA